MKLEEIRPGVMVRALRDIPFPLAAKLRIEVPMIEEGTLGVVVEAYKDRALVMFIPDRQYISPRASVDYSDLEKAFP